MVEKYELARTKLQSKIFTPFGIEVTLKKESSPTYNDRGEITEENYVESTITIVPYNIMTHRRSYQSFGNLNEGDFDAAVPYSVDIAKGDLIYWESENWTVTEIEKNFLSENVVTIVRLTRKQS